MDVESVRASLPAELVGVFDAELALARDVPAVVERWRLRAIGLADARQGDWGPLRPFLCDDGPPDSGALAAGV